jgi:hypothetical protein
MLFMLAGYADNIRLDALSNLAGSPLFLCYLLAGYAAYVQWLCWLFWLAMLSGSACYDVWPAMLNMLTL